MTILSNASVCIIISEKTCSYKVLEDGLDRVKDVVKSDLLTPEHSSEGVKRTVTKHWHI